MFSLLIELIIFVSAACSFVKMISCGLNPNFVLNVCANVFLHSIITLIANFSSIKVC